MECRPAEARLAVTSAFEAREERAALPPHESGSSSAKSGRSAADDRQGAHVDRQSTAVLPRCLLPCSLAASPACSLGGEHEGPLDPVAEGNVHKLVKFVTQRVVVTRRIIIAGVRSNWLTRSGSLTATATTVANADYVESRHLDGAMVQVAGQRATSPAGPRPPGLLRCGFSAV